MNTDLTNNTGNLYQPYFSTKPVVGNLVYLGTKTGGHETWGVVRGVKDFNKEKNMWGSLVRGMYGNPPGNIHLTAVWGY